MSGGSAREKTPGVTTHSGLSGIVLVLAFKPYVWCPESWGSVTPAVDKGTTPAHGGRWGQAPTRGRRRPRTFPAPRRLGPERVCGRFGRVTASPTEAEMRFLLFLLMRLVGSFADIIENSENMGEMPKEESVHSLRTLSPRN